jgi:uncharacterized protein (TIGR02391 family)
MSLNDLNDADMLALPLDRLALVVLEHIKVTDEWNTYNVQNDAGLRGRGYQARCAISEALNWLLSHGLIAHGKPGQTDAQSMIITRQGQAALDRGLAPVLAMQRLSTDLHPSLERVRSQFLLGEYELAAFAALREVEIRVRELAKQPNTVLGVGLMRLAWHPQTGPLTDEALDPGERQAIADLFAGALGTFKNPPSHRQVDYDDPVQASEIVLLADLLLRMLDTTALRIGEP